MEKKYGTPCELDRGERMGMLLFMFLEDTSKDQDNKYRQYSTEMKFKLSSNYFHRRGSGLTRTNIVHLNNFIEEDIKMQMRVYVHAKSSKRIMSKASAINCFLEMFGFNESELSFETAKKDIDRNINRIMISKSA